MRMPTRQSDWIYCTLRQYNAAVRARHAVGRRVARSVSSKSRGESSGPSTGRISPPRQRVKPEGALRPLMSRYRAPEARPCAVPALCGRAGADVNDGVE